ncbi:hypothetical protein [Thioalkalivibrio sp. ALJ3]|uniref:hypothetical protein n=1 Tax=Thioalkalivibrio sp. ALJ3 TaxID=1240557 RepID=UPI0003741959|nr:hypothetical protein [Thioalkalivibrio sp. ALJ3]
MVWLIPYVIAFLTAVGILSERCRAPSRTRMIYALVVLAAPPALMVAGKAFFGPESAVIAMIALTLLAFVVVPWLIAWHFLLRHPHPGTADRDLRSFRPFVGAWHRHILFLGIAAFVFVGVMLTHNRVTQWLHGYVVVESLDVGPHDSTASIRKANINGVPIAIPSNYLALVGIEYKDQSAWAPRSPDTPKPDELTFEDDAQAFSLYVRWPDMVPRSPETQSSFWTRDDPDGDVWLLIGVVAISDFRRDGQFSYELLRERGDWAPALRGVMQRLDEGERITHEWDDEKGRYKYLKNVRYEMRGRDPETGLQWAQPVGPGTDKLELWNQTLYWKGDVDGVVTDYFQCRAGSAANPDFIHTCRYKFTIPEWGARVAFRFPRDKLVAWREMKVAVRDLILGLEVDSVENAEEGP